MGPVGSNRRVCDRDAVRVRNACPTGVLDCCQTCDEGDAVPASPYPDDDRIKVHTIRATGAVYLHGPELDIIDTAEFQRMGAIKQLGTSYFVFRGAVHTRFEHSLGALEQAQRIIDAVNDNPKSQRRIDATGIRVARLAALLHDLPHVPFGHTLEDEFGLLVRHDDNRPRIRALLVESDIGEILRSALENDEYELLLDVLDINEPDAKLTKLDKDERLARRLKDRAYIADIVANTVCADVLDYIVRDLSACGMPVALGDRFLDFFAITPTNAPVEVNRSRMALRLDKRGMPRPDVESEIIKLLTYRYELAERVFFHHAKNAASVMIGRAVALLGLHDDDANFHTLGDDVLLALLAHPELAKPLGKTVTTDKGRLEGARELGQLASRRALYKLAYLGVYDEDVSGKAADIYARWGQNPAARQALEDDLAAKAGVASGRVLVHLPDPHMMAKIAQVRVILDDGTVTTFEEWEARHATRVQALNTAHQRLWRVSVYLHPEDAQQQATKRLVSAAAREVFGLRSRYAEPPAEHPYFATVFDLFADEEGWPAGARDAVIEGAPAAAAHADQPGSLEAAREIVRQVLADVKDEETPQARLPQVD